MRILGCIVFDRVSVENNAIDYLVPEVCACEIFGNGSGNPLILR